MTEWWYLEGDQQRGPVSEEGLRDLVTRGVVAAQTYVWREGMADWAPAWQATALFPAGRPAAGPFTAEQMQELFRRWITLVIASIVTAVLAGVAGENAAGAGLALAALVMIVIGAVLQLILLYRFWSVIQDGGASTTPGRAVGFLFIPLFNVYWLFRAFYRLAVDMQRYVRERGIRVAEPRPPVALAFCIVTILSVIPRLAELAGLVQLLLALVLYRQFKDAAVGILRWKQRRGNG